jgi:hypothetical protein
MTANQNVVSGVGALLRRRFTEVSRAQAHFRRMILVDAAYRQSVAEAMFGASAESDGGQPSPEALERLSVASDAMIEEVWRSGGGDDDRPADRVM